MFEMLCKAGVLQDEIACLMETDEVTIDKMCQRKLGKRFSAYRVSKRPYGRGRLRQRLYSMAMEGSVPLMIFLAKQKDWLGYSDRPEDNEPAHGTFNFTLRSSANQAVHVDATPAPVPGTDPSSTDI